MPRRDRQPESLAGAFETLRADYNAAKSSRFRRRRTGVASAGSGADYHYASESDYLRIMEQSRDMDRNDAIAGPVVNRAVTNLVQDGFSLDTQTGDKRLDVDLWERWNDWACDPDQCDDQGEFCFYDFEQLVPRAVYVDGDIVPLLLQDGGLQMVEGHRVRTPRNTRKNVVHGVLLDDHRRRLEYWITKEDVSPLAAVNKVNEVQPVSVRDDDGERQVLHVYDPKRVTQTRGVSAFAPIFDVAGMFEDIQFAKLIQQQVVSCFTVLRTRELLSPASTPAALGPQTVETQTDGTTRTLENLGPGSIVDGQPGEKLEGFSPNVPNAEFFQHVKLILTLIGINLGLPLVLVLMDASETNFSGWRGAVDEARRGFRRNQRWLINRFHKPVYRWKVRQWMAEDAALAAAAKRSGVNIFGHRWNSPCWPYIEPLKDASADLLRLRSGLISPRRLQAERGRDYQELTTETIADNAYAIARAKHVAAKINQRFDDGQPVHWRELLSLPTPEGVQINLQGQEEQSGDQQTSKRPGQKAISQQVAA